ncbi:mitogen-activated protein kinase 4-like [Lycium barbarum]|uniref:mitogen-activated protein kinase 4-like n=1 Tax=Lycium barbarum TaxID=112863 RepID=UPI00293EC0C8|nr:mitogen-activated protein kinase 4-like [Lycium barbarum]
MGNGNGIALKDEKMPTHSSSFKDIYLFYELMDTKLNHMIKSTLPLSNDHCKYFLFQVLASCELISICWLLLFVFFSPHHRDIDESNIES